MLPLYFTTVSAVPAARTAGAGRGFDEGTLSQLQDMAGRSGEQCVSTAATEAHYKQEEHVMNYVSMTMKRLGYKKLIFKNVSKERVQKKSMEISILLLTHPLKYRIRMKKTKHPPKVQK